VPDKLATTRKSKNSQVFDSVLAKIITVAQLLGTAKLPPARPVNISKQSISPAFLKFDASVECLQA
jgi:hypothetical protein